MRWKSVLVRASPREREIIARLRLLFSSLNRGPNPKTFRLRSVTGIAPRNLPTKRSAPRGFSLLTRPSPRDQQLHDTAMADNAADVAEDYRQALEDLTINSRIEIATLTNIARENANHGFAIAEVLQNHIKRVGHHRNPLQCVADYGEADRRIGTAFADITSTLRAGLDRQERPDTVCAVLRAQAVFDLHGRLHQGR